MNDKPIVKQQKRNTQKGRPGYLDDPRNERKGEKVGGGFFVFRRTSKTNRIRTPEWPFEHPTIEAATDEAERLSERYPGEKFVVLSEINALP